MILNDMWCTVHSRSLLSIHSLLGIFSFWTHPKPMLWLHLGQRFWTHWALWVNKWCGAGLLAGTDPQTNFVYVQEWWEWLTYAVQSCSGCIKTVLKPWLSLHWSLPCALKAKQLVLPTPSLLLLFRSQQDSWAWQRAHQPHAVLGGALAGLSWPGS